MMGDPLAHLLIHCDLEREVMVIDLYYVGGGMSVAAESG